MGNRSRGVCQYRRRVRHLFCIAGYRQSYSCRCLCTGLSAKTGADSGWYPSTTGNREERICLQTRFRRITKVIKLIQHQIMSFTNETIQQKLIEKFGTDIIEFHQSYDILTFDINPEKTREVIQFL